MLGRVSRVFSSLRSHATWNLGRLNHVAIAVPNLDEATAFYRHALKNTADF